MNKRVKKIINCLQPYVNGKLITHVFVKLWDELVEILKEEEND